MYAIKDVLKNIRPNHNREGKTLEKPCMYQSIMNFAYKQQGKYPRDFPDNYQVYQGWRGKNLCSINR